MRKKIGGRQKFIIALLLIAGALCIPLGFKRDSVRLEFSGGSAELGEAGSGMSGGGAELGEAGSGMSGGSAEQGEVGSGMPNRSAPEVVDGGKGGSADGVNADNLLRTSVPYLPEGAYRVYVLYTAEQNGGFLEISSDSAIGPDNLPGILLARVELPGAAGAGTDETARLKDSEVPWYPGETERTGNAGSPEAVTDRLREISVPLILEESVYNPEFSVHYAGGELGVRSITVESEGILFTDFFIIAALCLAGAFFVWRLPEGKPRADELWLLLAVAAATLPCLGPGLADGHDVRYHLARIEGIYRGILRGDIPLHINPVQMNGYGYLSGSMYPQLFLYLPALLRLCGVSLLTSYKLFLLAINLATVFLARGALGRLCGRKAGVWAAVFYTVSPYRLLDIYTRGALGEVLALVFLPAVLYGAYEVLWGERKRWLWLALGLTGVLQSHLLSVEMCGIFLGLAGLVRLAGMRSLKELGRLAAVLCRTGALVLGLNLFFLIPFLYYGRAPLWIYRIKYSLQDSAASWGQILNPLVGAGGENLTPGSVGEEMSYGIGAALALGCILFLMLYFLDRKKEQGRVTAQSGGEGAVSRRVGEKAEGRCGRGKTAAGVVNRRQASEEAALKNSVCFACLILGMLACFLASDLFPWEWLQRAAFLDTLLSPLQFAWRFLGLGSLFLSVPAAAFVVMAERNGSAWRLVSCLLPVLAAATLIYYYRDLAAQETVLADRLAAEGMDTTDYLYLYGPVDEEQFSREQAFVQVTGESEVSFENYRKEGTHIWVDVQVTRADAASWLVFPLYSYWGYEISVNGEAFVPAQRAADKVAFPLPAEGGNLEVRYRPHWSFLPAGLLSLLTAAGTAYWSMRSGVIAGVGRRPSGAEMKSA